MMKCSALFILDNIHMAKGMLRILVKIVKNKKINNKLTDN